MLRQSPTRQYHSTRQLDCSNNLSLIEKKEERVVSNENKKHLCRFLGIIILLGTFMISFEQFQMGYIHKGVSSHQTDYDHYHLASKLLNGHLIHEPKYDQDFFDSEFKSNKLPKSLFTAGNLPSNITILAIKHLYFGKSLPKNFTSQILVNAKLLLYSLPSVVDIDIPDDKNITNKIKTHVTIIGDNHGQFYGVMHLFEKYGFPTPNSPYVFSGDIIDGGDFSFKLLLSLLMIKLSCPACIHFVRGNHEVEHYFGGKIKKEIKKAYGNDTQIYDIFVNAVKEIPIAVLLRGSKCKVFVMHGGITANDLMIEHITNIKRGRDPMPESFFEHLLWADPHKKMGVKNGGRGILFGPDVTKSFLERNDLCFLIRGHTYVPTGYLIEHDKKLVTLSSSPKEGDQGAILQLDSEMGRKIYTFNSSPYPEVRNWQDFTNFEVEP